MKINVFFAVVVVEYCYMFEISAEVFLSASSNLSDWLVQRLRDLKEWKVLKREKRPSIHYSVLAHGERSWECQEQQYVEFWEQIQRLVKTAPGQQGPVEWLKTTKTV